MDRGVAKSFCQSSNEKVNQLGMHLPQAKQSLRVSIVLKAGPNSVLSSTSYILLCINLI